MEITMRKFISMLLSVCLITGTLATADTSSAATIKLNKTKYSMYTGSSVTLKVKGTSKKATWTSSKRKVATVTSKGKVTALKKGKAKITAKVNGQKLRCTITVRKRPLGKGTKASPKSAYASNSFTFYEEGKKIGAITMKLENFLSGEEAADYITTNKSNPKPASNQEYLYFKFKIKYTSGSQTIKAKDVFNYYYNIYGKNSTKQLTNLDWGFFFENVDDLGQTLLSPGNTVTCSKAVLVKKGYSPITYRIQTGKNSYTWFSTER